MENLKYQDGKLEILDQRLLPNEAKWLPIDSKEAAFEAIQTLAVRGAPAIGIFAAFSMALFGKDDPAACKAYLDSARPTAVNLSWATARLAKVMENGGDPVAEALAVQAEDIEMCRKISAYGLSLLRDGDGLLTHCNAGELATSRYGTGLGPILLGKEKGYNFKVFSDETRPLLQGARLTSYELEKAGVDVTLICDNMSGTVMKQGLVQAVFVGCDRVAANGDTANKIGTSVVATVAKRYHVPFYVCAPTSTIDLNTATGDDICIEERPAEEVTEMWYQERMAPEGVKVYNPAFDVTDHDLISGIVTEYGIAREPYTESLKEILSKGNA